MAPFPKHIFLNLTDIAELPNRTLVDIMAIVVHLDTIHRTMWGPFKKIVIMDARVPRVFGSYCNTLQSVPSQHPLFWTYIVADENGSKSLGPNVDAKERKRQRERERYVVMTIEQKNEKSRKRHELTCILLYMGETVNFEISGDVHLGSVSLSDGCSTIDLVVPNNNTSLTDNFIERERQRHRERRAKMSVDQRNELNKKRCEARQQNKGQHMMSTVSGDGDEKVNVNQDDDSDWLHRNETFKVDDVFTTRDLLTPGSKIEYIRKHRALLADTLSQESISMESPTYTLEVVHPTTDTIELDGSAVTPCDWVIPEIASNPFLPASTQTEDVDSLHMSTGPLRRKQHVPRGERQAILARRNRQFEASISRNMATMTEDTISDAGEGDDWTQPHMTAKINNNVQCRNQCHGAIVATNESASMTEQGSGVDHTQSKPRVIYNVDDDDGVVFEDDADENEGYLFARQYEDTDEDIEIDGSKDESIATDVPDPYDKVYNNIPEETHMLKTVPNYGYCTAKKFEYETPGFCCRGGKVELAPLETPPQQKRLWDSADSDARHFRDNISMTTNVRDSGIYMFRAQGMMYHNIKSFGREGGAEHKHLELYFYDDDPTLEHRYQSPSHLCVSVRDYYCYKFQIHPGDRLRADLYQGLVDSMLDGDIRAEKVGKRTVLSTSFIGGPRDMRRRYMDVMALVRKFGKPDIFRTMTCNPNWDDIRRELLPGQTPQDRLGLVVRVFHAKLQELKHRLTKQDILGKVRAYFCVVEFQKRGLLHVHFLLIMQRKYKLTCPEQYGLLISAEIPSNKYPELQKMVIKHMMHGPCGSLNPNYPCTKGRKSCKNHYPRPFSDTALQGKDSYPIYRRRDDDRKEKVRGCELDNRWVVPYNPYLLRLFNCHINVEACGSIKAVKYLFKYIYKGHDRVSIVMRDASKADDDVDEIKQYRDARWVTTPEALWKIYDFELSQISSPVMQLLLHLPNMHMVAFHERQMVERVLNRPGVDRSMLIAYFEANRLHEEARGILYRDFPEWYTWQSGKGKKHKDSMSKDYQHRSQNKTHVEQMVLIDIRNMLQSMGKDIKTFPLPPIIGAYDDAIGTASEVYEEESIQSTAGDVALKDSLNEEQRAAYDKIMSAIDTDQGGLFFVDGPSGTGKTYLYRVLLATLCNQGKIAVAIATSGVVASIMPGGRTAHSRFKIPLTINDGAICSFTKQSGTAELQQKASLNIWDEASMTKRQVVEALDNSMRDIMGRPALPFGGKTIVFGGDFRHVLPIVRKGSRAQVVTSLLWMSYLWESMSHLKLVSNMRTKNDPWFAEFLLCVGGGTEDTNSDGDIRLPDEVCVPYSGSDNDLDNLIDFTFPNLNENMSDSTYITSRAILSTRNDWVDMINVKIIDRFQGEHMVYHSFDSTMDDPHNYYPPEFLNTLTPNGLPPHVLKLKIGCPVILLWNIDPANGLCNGTRLVVRGFQRNSIDTEIVLGQHIGKRIFLPRIPLCPSDEEMFPF
ncbi:hypothetical protein ZEAMMB73_Zm00001d019382 [Zea mays]|uniref:ATP-dependent DNA helicase n=1 Tax=Zea mays TaxID=4577 RepID=A0A1D6HX83_MAIZE|nr:hypothetical protein ZEAMMB73_Zm00001d019382 [Zea mays]